MLSSILSNMPDLSSLSGQASKVLTLLADFVQSGQASSDMISEFVDQITSTSSMAITAFFFLLAIIGCFFGYKLARLFMTLTGFIAGAFLGVFVAIQFLDGSNLVVIAGALIGGFILAFFSYKIYQAGIFILCFFLGFVVAANLIPLTGNVQFFLCTLTGFVLGTLALKYVRPVIILSSAIVCGRSAAESLIILGPLTKFEFFNESYAFAVSFLALAALGTLIQFLTTKDPDAKRKKKKKEDNN